MMYASTKLGAIAHTRHKAGYATQSEAEPRTQKPHTGRKACLNHCRINLCTAGLLIRERYISQRKYIVFTRIRISKNVPFIRQIVIHLYYYTSLIRAIGLYQSIYRSKRPPSLQNAMSLHAPLQLLRRGSEKIKVYAM
jgi:hypothetical protein